MIESATILFCAWIVSQEFGKGAAGTFLCSVTFEAAAEKAHRRRWLGGWGLMASQGLSFWHVVRAGSSTAEAFGRECSRGALRVTGLPPSASVQLFRLLTGRLGHPGANIPANKGQAASPFMTV